MFFLCMLLVGDYCFGVCVGGGGFVVHGGGILRYKVGIGYLLKLAYSGG